MKFFRQGRKRLFALVLLVIAGGGLTFRLLTPSDIRPASFPRTLTKANKAKAKQLLLAMEKACGGFQNWKKRKGFEFVMSADWYGFPNTLLGGWPTSPQKFSLRSQPGTDDSELTLLNSKKRGLRWGLQKGKGYTFDEKGTRVAKEHSRFQQKLIFKNYWFQFPFRIREATILGYAGQTTVGKTKYELVFATWGSLQAHRKADQFLLFLNARTHRLEWLVFTVREGLPAAVITAHFTEYKTTAGITLPHLQQVTFGEPGKAKLKLHENRIHSVRWFQ